MYKVTAIIIFCLTFLAFTFAYASELVKGIHYLGTENNVKSYHIICNNGKKGDIYVNLKTKKVRIKKDDSFIYDLGQIRFGDAIKKICQ